MDSVAIYLDFENLAISAEQAYPSQDMPLQLEPIIDFCSAKGNLAIRRAYADWSKGGFSRYQKQLMEQGFELVYLPETSMQGKNGSDVRLAVDVMESLELFKTVNKIIIGSGDTDFIPLIQRVRSRGIEVTVIGFEHSVGTLVAKNSSEFKSVEELIGDDEDYESDEEGSSGKYGRDVLIRHIRNIDTDEPVLLSSLKHELQKLEPGFSEKKARFGSFKKFLESFRGDLIERITSDGPKGQDLVHFKRTSEMTSYKVDKEQDAQNFLNRRIKYQPDKPKRLKLYTLIQQAFKESHFLTLEEVTSLLQNEGSSLINRQDVPRFINVLYTARVFIQKDNREQGPLLKRSFMLRKVGAGAEDWDEAYVEEVHDRLLSRFPDLDEKVIKKLGVS